MTTHYGIEVARKLAYQLAYIGVTVVSGGARGIDTAAHQGALSAKGRTVCVLGTGINIVFPPENKELFERIAANGAVITQYPFNRNADKQSFAIRNRIVAGMTLGTVVVEANLTSGALITSNFADGIRPAGIRRAGPHRFAAQQGLPRTDQERRETLRRRRGHSQRVRISVSRHQPARRAG